MSPPFLLVFAVTLFGFSTAAETDLTPVVNRHLQSSSSPPDWHVVMLDAVNKQRAANGVRPLCMNTKLQIAAQLHSTDMARYQCMDHKGSDNSQPKDRIGYAGYIATTCGENVASGQPTIEAVMTSWMQSPKHRANILCPSFTMFACGYGFNGSSLFPSYWTQVFASSNTELCL